MLLFSRIGCVSVVALFCVATVSSADELPVGAWKLHVGGEDPSALVITEVKADGKVIAEVFGRRIEGKWDGTKLSFKTGTGKPTGPVQMWRSFEGWMMKEKQGENVRYTLAGNFKLEGYCLKLDVCRGWYAHHDLIGKKQ
jgi:hypothetical protein